MFVVVVCYAIDVTYRKKYVHIEVVSASVVVVRCGDKSQLGSNNFKGYDPCLGRVVDVCFCRVIYMQGEHWSLGE